MSSYAITYFRSRSLNSVDLFYTEEVGEEVYDWVDE